MRSREAQLNDIGTGFDLDQTTKALSLAGVTTRWMDYSDDSPDGWDMDAYYQFFDSWFVHLPLETKERIVSAIVPELYARLTQ